MKIKKIEKKEFLNRNIDVYTGIKDYFGKSCLLLVNNDLMEWQLVQKYEDYERKKKYYQQNKINVIPEKYGKVIDVTRNVYENITAMFEGYRHPLMQIWN